MLKEYKIIITLAYLLFSLPFLANAQSLNEKDLITKLTTLPRFSSEQLYVKLKNKDFKDISYHTTSGFIKNYINPDLEKILKKYNIIRIDRAFRLKSDKLSDIYKISFSRKSQEKIDKLIIALNQSNIFEYIEKLPLHYPMLTPNDFNNYPSFYHGIIQTQNAWDLTSGNSSVAIAVIDDGFLLNHDDLAGKVYSGSTDIPGNGIDDDNNGYIDDYQGWDVADMDNDPSFPVANQLFFTHGTAIAGIIAANTNNNIGISSVGFNCTYIPVKLKNDASTSNSLINTYEGLEYAIASNARVICIPWASMDSSQTFQLLCNIAFNAGKTLVAAAGNTGSDIALYPASYPDVISVGATNANDMVSAYSSFNERVDVMAPGNGIYSCSSAGTGQYAIIQGTSSSAAIASGILGLMIAKNPSMTPAELENCLKNGAANINSQNQLKIGKIGAGRVNAFDALTCAENPPIGNCHGNPVIFACPQTQFILEASSFGLSALSWEWILPGANPSHAFGSTISISYAYPGYYDVILIGCNTFGCDTAIYTDRILVGLPTANLISSNGSIFCKGTYMYLDVALTGNPPFKIAYTNGVQTDTIYNILSNHFSIPVSPASLTTYSLTHVEDSKCIGTVSGSITVNPVDCGPCSNSDFEFGNFVTWKGELGRCCGIGNYTNGISSDRQTIISGNLTDPYSNNLVPMVCPLWSNNLYSARLGNWFVGGQAEKLSKRFLVTTDNSNFTFAYSVFLEDPINHTQIDKPKFEFNILDSAGIQIPDSCAHFDVTAGPATSSWHHNGLLRFTDWQMVGVDLSQYIGHPVTVQFKTEDCGLLGHFGYSYIDATCGPSSIYLTNLCDTNSVVTLSAPLGYNHYYWIPSGDTTQSINITGLHQNDTISVHMTNVMGCSSTLKHIVNITPKPIAIAYGDTSICLQGSASLSASGAGIGGTYTWSSIPAGFTSNSQNITVTPSQTTIYKVKVINANGCEADSMPEVKVTVLTNAFFDLGSDVILCEDDTLFLNATVSGQLLWSSYPPGFTSTDTTISIVPEINPKYYILSYNNGSCSFRDSIKVSLFNYQYQNPITIVNYCSGQLTVQLNAPTNYISYYWLNNGDTTQTITVNTQAYQLFKVAMVSQQGCLDTTVFMLKPIPDPIAFAGNDTSVCKGLGVGLTATGSSSLQATYQWTSIPSGFTANLSNITVFPQSDTYYVVAVSNGVNCPSPVSYDTVFVSVFTTPAFNLGSDINICKGDTISLYHYTPGTFNYWSSDPVGFHSTDTIIFISPDSTTTYFLSVIDSICSSIDDITVIVKEGNVAGQTINKLYCPYDSIVSITAPNGYIGYHWLSGGDTTQTITLLNPPLDTTFVILGKNPISTCYDTIIMNLKRMDEITTGLTISDTIICIGTSITLQATNDTGFTYQWYAIPSGIISGNYIVTDTPGDTTKYYLTIVKGNCNFSDSIQVNVINIPPFNLGNDTSICYGDSIVLYPKIPYFTYLWDDGSDDTIRFISKTTDCKLTVSLNACYQEDMINIIVHPAEDSTVIPNVITPNGDGFNDKLMLKNMIINDFSLEIFNRWGQKVFNTDDKFFSWDASFNSGSLSAGTYFYLAKYYSVCRNKKIDETGIITILR